ncbi:MAG: nucleoside hydrolase [Acidobacteria bacterium]|nr:nucleoside hydrolase [Acidobacteriota bacterium]
MMQQRLIIDTDPGVDDMIAILSALHCQDIDLLALTTVGGNVSIEGTTRNALRILARVNRTGVPVYAGLSAAHTAQHVHGGDGLSGCSWPDSPVPARPESAIGFLTRELTNSGITLACLGPLTNLAAVLKAKPELACQIERVVIMGGGFGTYSFRAGEGVIESRGNVTPEAEFNIYSDISAARVVFESGVPVTVVPLDISQRTLVSQVRLERLDPVVAGILDRYFAFSRERWGTDAGPLHDPNVIAYIARPDLYTAVRGTVTILPNGGTDFEAGAGVHQVLLQVDAEGYLDWVWDRLSESGLQPFNSSAKRAE